MFSIEQINDLHARLGSARTLPEYVLALKGLGVERYDSSWPATIRSTSGGAATGSPPYQCTRSFPSLKPVNAGGSFSTCGARRLTYNRDVQALGAERDREVDCGHG